MPRLLHVLTVPDSLVFFERQLDLLRAQGFEVALATSPGARLWEVGRRYGVPVHPVLMPRAMSPMQDAAVLARLVALMRQFKPDIVHSHTPKGGLLGTLAAEQAGVRVRLYHLRGLLRTTATGLRRALFTLTEQLACGAATGVLSQSHTLRAEAIDAGLCPAGKIQVLHHGSNGVDAEVRFNPGLLGNAGPALRAEHRIPSDALVYAFVGRLVRDKGVIELAEAFSRLAGQHPEAWLLLCGDWEERDAVPSQVRDMLERHPRVVSLGFQRNTAAVYAAADVVVLPTWREGFPNVPLEAAAMARPMVATRIPGCIDAVREGETGLLVEPGQASALEVALATYAREPLLRRTHGDTARARVLRDFRPEDIWAAQLRVYREALRHVDS